MVHADLLVGTATADDAWTYTPSLNSSVAGDTTNGGTLTISWVTDPTVGGQLVTLWLHQIGQPLIFGTIGGYAGKIQAIPFVFIVQGFGEALTPLPLPFPPIPPQFANFPFHLQAVMTGEGTVNGSFSNVSTFSVP